MSVVDIEYTDADEASTAVALRAPLLLATSGPIHHLLTRTELEARCRRLEAVLARIGNDKGEPLHAHGDAEASRRYVTVKTIAREALSPLCALQITVGTVGDVAHLRCRNHRDHDGDHEWVPR